MSLKQLNKWQINSVLLLLLTCTGFLSVTPLLQPPDIVQHSNGLQANNLRPKALLRQQCRRHVSVVIARGSVPLLQVHSELLILLLCKVLLAPSA
jgi:hypothetical protein